ncbi:MAG: alpha-amylase family glycosyl hydrolase, partial [Melioribacteraceae bacterium]
YNNLNERARARGIRLASDMVPNHTGIYSKWVIEHPEYFIQSPYPPFPNYSFNGEDLSDDPSVQLRIEDGYWEKRDAAVVFQRTDVQNGDARYIYHGNDGTNMPWNDTAQLNMIRKDVREAVIQKIFEVARKFSIIRFDAAMTLAKKHFSRLWYPEPGKGGDIPSRADYAMTREEFDRTFPDEFWREVVDRINAEMPDTLLLAEAFWLMEGYFVRTLGMHRVYNSAFMHMMMKEENSKYRDLISNTLEFEPEILKRYVNFMSNPDEETAIRQFGTDDKYFGVCALMVTLPGLPMFAHGQIEGYTEKYGMEYQRAYYNESPDQWLVDRHKREIFPLMKKRYLFSQVANFWLFDFIDGYGSVNENVYAYTNSEHGEHALILFNNKYENTSGRIFNSSPKLMSNYGGGKENRTVTIASALNINPAPGHFYIFRDHISNLEFTRTGSDIAQNGFYAELGAFKLMVCLDWRLVYDQSGDWEKLVWKLENSGVPDMMRAFREFKLETIHYSFEQMFDEESIEGFIKTCVVEERKAIEEDRISFVDEKYSGLLNIICGHFGIETSIEPVLKKFEEEIVGVRKLNRLLDDEYPPEKNLSHSDVHKAVRVSRDTNYHDNSIIFMLLLIISNIKELFPEEGGINRKNYFDEMLLDTPVRKILLKLGKGSYEVFREITLLNISRLNLDGVIGLFDKDKKAVDDDPPGDTDKAESGLAAFLKNELVTDYLGVNEHETVVYYSKENFEELIDWLFTLSALRLMECGNDSLKSPEECFQERTQLFRSYWKNAKAIISLSERSEYKFDLLIKNLLGGSGDLN